MIPLLKPRYVELTRDIPPEASAGHVCRVLEFDPDTGIMLVQYGTYGRRRRQVMRISKDACQLFDGTVSAEVKAQIG
jgi:hypothetical protein